MDIEAIKQKLREKHDVFRDQFHVKKLGIFGSTARGEALLESDIDILVEFVKPVGFFEFMRLENYLSDLCGKKVDLVSRNALKPIIKEAILQETVYV